MRAYTDALSIPSFSESNGMIVPTQQERDQGQDAVRIKVKHSQFPNSRLVGTMNFLIETPIGAKNSNAIIVVKELLSLTTIIDIGYIGFCKRSHGKAIPAIFR